MYDKIDLFGDLDRLAGASVLVIGDVMLDRFVYGAIDRISPEAPVPVLLVESEKAMLGGAGNVVANLAALDVKATLLGTVGSDAAGRDIAELLKKIGARAELVETPDRTTTVKSRFVCGAQQMLRVDREKTETVSTAVEAHIIARLESLMNGVGAVILSDYKKGLLTDKIVRAAIAAATAKNIPVIVDPKGRDFARYAGASFVTPNKKELELATGMKVGTDEEVRAAAMKVVTSYNISAVLATRSAQGMSLISNDADPVHIPARVREVYDVSGAGDTVIATFAAALAGGINATNAALLANLAAGIVVGKSGTATARVEEIRAVLAENISTTKLVSRDEAAATAEKLKARGRIVGFTNGCFDLLHPGHLSSLRQAKANCDFLVVALNSDDSVRRLKGPTRPVQSEEARADVLSALSIVDMVVIFDEDSVLDTIKAIKPDVIVKGGQYKLEEVVGYDFVTAYGGKIVRAEMEDGFSTTNTIKKMAS